MPAPGSTIRGMRTSTELRAVVDAFAARHAARRVAAAADKRPLLAAFKRMQRAAAADDYAAMAEADRALHLAIVDLAGVEGLAATWRVAAEPMEKFRVSSLEQCWPDLDVLFEAHRPIVDAILAGDAVAAEDAARVHLDAVWYRIADTSADASLPDDPLARACAYLDLHMQQPLQLAFVAEHVARTSAGHLARLFRQRYGMSFTRYVRELRMHKAVGLLTGTSQPIGRIARIVGYADASRFALHFRRRYGLTPRAYRTKFGGVRAAAEG
jgi:AraC-like DNA-binding protein